MRRRDFLTGLLATTGAGALWAGEPNKVYRLAVCSQGGMDSFATTFWPILFNRLPEMGFTEGKNLIVDRYATEGRTERYEDIARSMVQAKPDVIALGFDHQFILQVAKETTTIPIVASFGDPVAAGIVKNMARPERNITGVSLDAGIAMQGNTLKFSTRLSLRHHALPTSQTAQNGKGLGGRLPEMLAMGWEFQSSAYHWNGRQENRNTGKPSRPWPSNRLKHSWSTDFLESRTPRTDTSITVVFLL